MLAWESGELLVCASGSRDSFKGSATRASNIIIQDHINIRISHSGSEDQYKGDTRNHGWWYPYV